LNEVPKDPSMPVHARSRALPTMLVLGALLGVVALLAVPLHAAPRKRSVSPLAGLLVYRTGMPEVVVHRELPIARIENLSGFRRSRLWQNPGLTIGKHELKTDFEVAGEQRSDRPGVKVYLESLEVTFQYTRLDVYVANDYAMGSCEEREITRHEMDHVATHRRVYERYKPLVKNAVLALDLPTKSRPKTYPSLSAAQRDISKRLRAATSRVFERFKTDLSTANNKLDTPAKYKAIQNRCKGWK